MGNSNN
jgi:hypothetical protein